MRYPTSHSVVVYWLLLIFALGCQVSEPPPATESTAGHESPPAADQAGAAPRLRGAMLDLEKARTAAQDGNLEIALAASLRALEQMPHHPAVIRRAAALHARTGQLEDALQLLERIAELGGKVDFDAEGEAWAPLREDDRFQAIAKRLRPDSASQPRGEIAIVLADAELYPEGIAYDPHGEAFLMGSMTRSKILRVTPDGSSSELVRAGQDGLLNPLGLAVDAERRGLWVASTAYPPYGGATLADAGRSAVFHFDLDSGELRQHLALDERPKHHFLNDLDVSTTGEVYITDSETSTIYYLAPDGAALEPWLELPELNAFNGIALSDDDRLLYVAHLEGMTRIDVASRQASRVAEAAGVAIAHGDGIVFVDNSLIVIQNQPAFDFRVARFFLDPEGRRAQRVEVLHAGLVDGRMPFTGALVGEHLYFNVTSDLDVDADPLPPALLRVKL